MAQHEEQTQPAGKGRPTPKRREAERGRRTPVAAPTTGREAAKLRRIEAAAERQRVREGWKAGDPSMLPKRDRGPVRKYVRDVVDSRMTVLEWFVPVAVVLWVGSFIPAVAKPALLGMMFFTLVVLAEAFVISFQLKRQMRRRFPAGSGADTKGAALYGVLRATQIRRIRMPKPTVKRFADVD